MIDSQLFPPELMAAPFRRSLTPERAPGNLFHGIHRSNQCGAGMEFQEYKPYLPGDELRHVDWNVYRRTKQLVLRQFRNDPRRQHRIILDATQSITFKENRHRTAWRVTALLAGAILAAGDALNLTITGDKKAHTFFPGAETAFQNVLECLTQAYGEKREQGDLFDFQQTRERTWIVSDFLDPRGLEFLERALRKSGPFTPLIIQEEEEVNPQPGQEFRLTDVETGEEVLWAADEASCREYRNRRELFMSLLRKAAASAQDRCYCFDADDDVRELIAVCLGKGDAKQC